MNFFKKLLGSLKKPEPQVVQLTPQPEESFDPATFSNSAESEAAIAAYSGPMQPISVTPN